MFWKFKTTKYKQKAITGFTLAEVLITLTIVGAVAALGVPAMMSRNDEFLMVNTVKRAHSSLTHLALMARANNELDGCVGIECAKKLIGGAKVGRECNNGGSCIEFEYASGPLIYNENNYVIAQGGIIYAWNDFIEIEDRTKYVSISVVPNIKKVDINGNVNQYTFWLDVDDGRIFPAGVPNLPPEITQEYEESTLTQGTVCPNSHKGCTYWVIKTGHLRKKAGEWYIEE